VTIFSGDSVVISLPGAEVHNMKLACSITEAEDVFANPISTELRSALQLLCEHARRHGLPVTCIARPELFTNSRSVAWLRDRVTNASHHVCLSDGSTVKHLPGMPTHVFFYCRSGPDNLFVLRQLSRRAPELMSGIQSQINSCFVLGWGDNRPRPNPVFLTRSIPLESKPAKLLPFFLNRDSAEDSVNRISQTSPISRDNITEFAEVRYLLLGGTALLDRAFAEFAATLIQESYFNPSLGLVLRLPVAPPGASPLLHGIAAILPALRESGVVFPRARPNNILLVTEDPGDGDPIFARTPRHVWLHESFDFWRLPVDFYENSRTVTIVSGRASTSRGHFLPDDVSEIYGAKSVRLWNDNADREDEPGVGVPA
jgi:hypothetical protein